MNANIVPIGVINITQMAVLISIVLAIIVLIYMFSHLFGIQELKNLSKRQIYNLIMTVVLISVIPAVLDEFSKVAIVGQFITTSDVPIVSSLDLQKPSVEIAYQVTDSYLSEYNTYFSKIAEQVYRIGIISSSSFNCKFIASRFIIPGCLSIGVFRGPYTTGLTVLSLAMTDLNSQLYFLDIISKYAFNVFIPFGIVMRLFSSTRDAGNFLISFAIAFYLIFPNTLLLLYQLTEDFAHQSNYEAKFVEAINKKSCDPSSYDNAKKIKKTASEVLSQSNENLLFHVVIKGILITIVSFMLTWYTIPSISKMLGKEVDVFAITRYS